MASINGASGTSSSASLPYSHSDDLEFVNLEDRHKCPYCHEVLKNPMQTVCGHRICEECVNKLFAEHGDSFPCPGKDEDCEIIKKDEVNHDFYAKRELGKLPVFCIFRKYGCKEKPRWIKLQAHVTECEYTPEFCPYKNNGCNERVGRKNLEEHVAICQHRTIQCDLCGQRVQPALLKEHKKTICPKTIITCPHKCPATPFPRENLDDHLRECPAKPSECKYKAAGCDFQGTASEMAKHEKQQMSKHLELTNLKVAHLELENTTSKRQMQEVLNEKDILKNKFDEVTQLLQAYTENQNTLEKKMRNVQKSMVGQGEKLIKMEQHVVDQPSKEDFDQQSREIAIVKDNYRDVTQRVRRVENNTGSGPGGIPDTVITQLSSHDRQIGIQDVRLAEMDLRFQVLETANYDGVLIWKIRDYRRRKHEAVSGKTLSLYSQPFYTGRYGYKMCARVYLNGDGMGKGSHMSLFFVVMRGDYDALLSWPFRQKCTLMLLDQETGRRHLSDTFRPDPTSSSFKRPTSEMNVASGCPLFVSQQVLESGNTYVKDDTIFIKVVVDTSDILIP